MYPQDTAETH